MYGYFLMTYLTTSENNLFCSYSAKKSAWENLRMFTKNRNASFYEKNVISEDIVSSSQLKKFKGTAERVQMISLNITGISETLQMAVV